MSLKVPRFKKKKKKVSNQTHDADLTVLHALNLTQSPVNQKVNVKKLLQGNGGGLHFRLDFYSVRVLGQTNLSGCC